MKTIFVATLDSYTYDMSHESKQVKMTKIIESENPQELLEAIQFTEGTKTRVPAVEKLLVHLFVTRAAYCDQNYTITIKSI